MTIEEIRKNKPDGADEYFIDYDNSINYLKDNTTMIHTRYLGWEESDIEYVSEFEVKPL